MAAIGGLIVLVGWLVSLVGSVMVLIKAFQESIVWGLCSLFIPFVILAFVITHWEDSKKGFLIFIAGVVVVVLGTILAVALGGPVVTTT